MNSVPTMTQNSVLSQNWVGCTPNGPWMRAHYAHCAQVGRVTSLVSRVVHCIATQIRVAGLADRVAHCIATQSLVAASLSSPPVTIQTLYHNTGPCSASCRAPELCRRAPYLSLGCIVSPPSYPRYNCCITTQLPAVHTMRRVARRPDRIVGRLAVPWPSSGRVVAYCAVSWRVPAHCLPALPVTIQCIVS